jgi:hypothetical protein
VQRVVLSLLLFGRQGRRDGRRHAVDSLRHGGEGRNRIRRRLSRDGGAVVTVRYGEIGLRTTREVCLE